jgi:hypothetical protein
LHRDSDGTLAAFALKLFFVQRGTLRMNDTNFEMMDPSRVVIVRRGQ